MTELETPVCDITAPLIMLYSYSDHRTEKDELGISPNFYLKAFCVRAFHQILLMLLLQQYFFFSFFFFGGFSSFNSRKAVCLRYLLNSHLRG